LLISITTETFFLVESRVVKGHVTRRSDDPHGQGFGNVKTGFVSSTKLSFLQQASGLDRDVSPAPSNGSSGRSKGLRVTWAESPGSSRPASNLGWVEGAAGSGLAAAAARAQTPPLAGEWASSSTNGAASSQTMMSMSRMNSHVTHQHTSIAANPASNIMDTQAVQSLAMANQLNSVSSFKSAHLMSLNSSQQVSSSMAFQSDQQVTNSSVMASSSSFSSAKSSSTHMSSFQSGKMSSLQSGKMHTFEAFPGLGEIENLCLEQGERVGK
jgi:hypothetical protein